MSSPSWRAAGLLSSCAAPRSFTPTVVANTPVASVAAAMGTARSQPACGSNNRCIASKAVWVCPHAAPRKRPTACSSCPILKGRGRSRADAARWIDGQSETARRSTSLSSVKPDRVATCSLYRSAARESIGQWAGRGMAEAATTELPDTVGQDEPGVSSMMSEDDAAVIHGDRLRHSGDGTTHCSRRLSAAGKYGRADPNAVNARYWDTGPTEGVVRCSRMSQPMAVH